MDDMMAELEAELAEARVGMKSLKKDMKSQLSTLSTTSSQVMTTDNIVRGPSHCFPKSSRFKIKDEKDLSESVFGQSVYSEAAPQEYLRIDAHEAIYVKIQYFKPIKSRKPNAIISKTTRFMEPKVDEQSAYEPNYDLVKRGTQQHMIAPLKQKAQLYLHQKLLQSGISQSELDELETQASMSQMGPGAYNIRYDQIDTKKSSAFTRGSRFEVLKVEEQININPNFNAVRSKPPTAKIAVKTLRSQQLQERDKITEIEEQQRIAQYFNRPLEMDNATRASAPTVVIVKSYKQIQAAAGPRQKRFLIMKLLDELKYQALGPGAYEAHEPKASPCTVVYRPHSAEGRRVPNLERPVPGPDYYYSKDDLVKTKAVIHEFGRADRYKKIRKQDIDMRLPLDIHDDLVHKQAPQLTIQPEQQNFSLIPNNDFFVQQRLGPGTYEPLSKIVEQRSDKGAVTMQPINERTDRVNLVNPVGKDREFHDYKEQLNPQLDAVKPHAPNFEYHEPTKHQPQHIPDKMLFPEQWQHYDVDLDVVREQVGSTIPHFGGRVGRGLIEFLRYQDDLDELKAYLKRKDNQPEIGQYDINFKRIDKDPRAVDFERYVMVDNNPIVKKEGFQEGDNLLLNPKLPAQHIQIMDFEKMLDRPEGPQTKDGPELILEPNIDFIKPRVKQIQNFEKQLDRPPSPKVRDTELLVEPQFTQVQPRVKGHMNFEKQVDREEDPRYVHKVDDRPLVVEPNDTATKPKQKCLTKINNGVPRFPKQATIEKNQIPAAINVSRLEKAEKATRPNIPGVSMKGPSIKQTSLKKKQV